MALLLAPPISDAYWQGQPVGQSAPILFGSARGGIVAAPSTDAAYAAWRALGYVAWPWPNDATGAKTTAALDAVLESYGLPPTGLTQPTLAQLQAALNAALDATADAITIALTPTRTHQVGFSNIAAIVTANGNAAPSTGADATSIASVATSFGTNSTGITTQAQALKDASLTLLAALVTAQTATLQATTATQLGAALAAFETSLASILSTINAVIAVPVASPPAISIAGIP